MCAGCVMVSRKLASPGTNRLIMREVVEPQDLAALQRLACETDCLVGQTANSGNASRHLGLYISDNGSDHPVGYVCAVMKSTESSVSAETLMRDGSDDQLTDWICGSLIKQGRCIIELRGFALRGDYRTARVARQLVEVATAWALCCFRADFVICKPWPGIKALLEELGYGHFPGTTEGASAESGVSAPTLLASWKRVPTERHAELRQLSTRIKRVPRVAKALAQVRPSRHPHRRPALTPQPAFSPAA